MASTSSNYVTETSMLLKALRQELKEWETSFFAANNRKAGREDIKQLPEIGDKYKEYNDLRYPCSKPAALKVTSPSRKRHHLLSSHIPSHTVTPNKRSKTAHALHPSTIDPYDPPVSTLLSPVTHRTPIGPTPQKDGMVLGLLDNLSSRSHSKTPSKRASLLPVTENVQTTPSKRPSPQHAEAHLPSTGKRHGRSPLTTSKQCHLNAYLTPSASRILKNSTPSSRSGVSKLRFDETPAFLRRDSQCPVPGKENEGLEEGMSWSPLAVRRLPKAYAGKGLSALVKGLREMEEARLDEELDMLREMEDGDAISTKTQQPKVMVIDSQRSDMPLGPDGNVESEDDTGAYEVEKRDGKPLKVWKKKGQKRTTRRVTMRPNAAKWKPEPVWQGGRGSGDEVEDALVEELKVSKQGASGDELGSEAGIEHANQKIRRIEDKKEGKEGPVTKVKKKISATAHANFRALKIKNKQSKGRRGGKFGRK